MVKKIQNKNFRNIFNALLLILVTGLVLYFSLKDNFFTIVHELLTLNLFWVLVAILVFVTSIIVRSYSMYFMVKKYRPEYTIRQANRLLLTTQFFNAVTPFATGGQPFQVYTLKKDGVRIADGTSIVVQNFIVYQIALVLLGILAVGSNYFFHIFKANVLLQSLTTIGFLMNTFVAIALLMIMFAKKFNDKVIRFLLNLIGKLHFISEEKKEQLREKLENTTHRLAHGGKRLLQDKRMFLSTIALNFIGLTLLYLVPLFVLFAMGDYTSVNPFVCIASSAYVMLIGAFVPIPGGTGGLEYSYVEFFGNFISGSKLQASMLVWRFVTYYFGMILGAIALQVKTKGRKKS